MCKLIQVIRQKLRAEMQVGFAEAATEVVLKKTCKKAKSIKSKI